MLHEKTLHFGNLTLGENEEIVLSSTIILLFQLNIHSNNN
jgi:hypothetical protein